jgi:hypothetical protein
MNQQIFEALLQAGFKTPLQQRYDAFMDKFTPNPDLIKQDDIQEFLSIMKESERPPFSKYNEIEVYAINCILSLDVIMRAFVSKSKEDEELVRRATVILTNVFGNSVFIKMLRAEREEKEKGNGISPEEN